MSKATNISLSPRVLSIPLGTQRQIVASITTDEGMTRGDLLANWKHSSENPAQLKISPKGFVFGNILGKTEVYAGAEGDSPIWNEIPVEIEVIEGETGDGGGKGFPQLLMTDKDIDPFTGQLRIGNPEQPALWQEVWDVKHNIWWLNMQSKDVNYAYALRHSEMTAWKLFHAKLFVEMMVQVWMSYEYINKGDEEKPELWSSHKANFERFQVDLNAKMWDKLSQFIRGEEEQVEE